MPPTEPIRIELPAASPPSRRCPKCRGGLWHPSVQAFAGTVFTRELHDCQRAREILAAAERGAAMFEANREFVHARVVTDRLTVPAWVNILQRATKHRLATVLVPLPSSMVDVDGNPIQFTISFRQDTPPDMQEVVAGIEQQARAMFG